MNIVPVIQRSPEWHAARAGSLGASQIADALAKTKSGYSTSRQNLIAELVAERLTGTPTARYNNTAMAWGVDNEEQARLAYAFEHDMMIEEVGLIRHPTIKGTHASPDGLVTDTSINPQHGLEPRLGLVEIKCPFVTAQHLWTLRTGEIKSEYYVQMQWQMACTGRAWCDYVSWDPRLPSELRLYVKRVPRDDDTIETLEVEVKAFLSDLEDLLAELKN